MKNKTLHYESKNGASMCRIIAKDMSVTQDIVGFVTSPLKCIQCYKRITKKNGVK